MRQAPTSKVARWLLPALVWGAVVVSVMARAPGPEHIRLAARAMVACE